MNTPILQVIGYQNSGKTLFLERFIKKATEIGLLVGVIKHHGHGQPDLYDETKDTGRHRIAGAKVTGVSGGGMLSLQATMVGDWELDRLLKLYQAFELDLILVEGYKEKPLPKIVMLRSKEDKRLLKMENIRYVITGEQMDTGVYPSYLTEKMDVCICDLLNELKGE
ncbi:molybdopterin-guanine dinucleotide biosynthesis protein B [Pseudalkalibacillus hwajinpoensis]|uniref:molybdopterin-guanine dinucleotide biosynthesis protein B n=1 Tax=Guptibacillus hwajinpoensis TaxID=208199 RepID=UPI00325C1E37